MKTARVHLRLTEGEKEAWEKKARKAGFFHNGEANVSGWLRSLADAAPAPHKRRTS